MASCELDCKAIHESWGRLSTLVRTLATRTTQIQRREIRETYKAMYGEDLLSHIQRLKKEILGNKESNFSFKACEALFLWMSEPWERDACLAKDALEGNEIDYNALVEIFVAKKSSHVLMVKQAYQTRFKRQLDQDIICLEPPHPCQKILLALSTSHKADDGDQVSQDIAKCDAIRLYQNGEGTSSSINEPFILEILSKRSISHLKLTFSSYKRIYGHNYTKQLKKESCTQFEDALRNLVECIQNPPKYYAKVLQRSIKGGNMKRDYLTRLIVSRAAIDMEEIQKILSKKYKIELRDALCQLIPKGDYRDFMLALIGVT